MALAVESASSMSAVEPASSMVPVVAVVVPVDSASSAVLSLEV